MKKTPIFLLFFLTAVFLAPSTAHANPGLIFRGLAKTVYAVAQVPANMIQGSAQSFPLGMVTGAVAGTMKMAVGTVMGAADMARGAAPYAKYAVFL